MMIILMDMNEIVLFSRKTENCITDKILFIFIFSTTIIALNSTANFLSIYIVYNAVILFYIEITIKIIF